MAGLCQSWSLFLHLVFPPLQIFPGLIYDCRETVTLVLSTLRSRVLSSDAISKTAKMKLFSAGALRAFFGLFDWKGPGGLKYD